MDLWTMWANFPTLTSQDTVHFRGNDQRLTFLSTTISVVWSPIKRGFETTKQICDVTTSAIGIIFN